MKREILKSLERLSYYERLSDQKQDDWDADPMNPDREAAADQAYDLAFREYIYAVHLISRFAGISEKEARIMVNTKRTELERILTA